MFWKRLPVSWKLFAVICGVTALVIAFVSALAVVNMRQGFALYLAQTELARFDELERRLAESHDEADPGWPELQGNRRDWNALVRSTLPPPPPRGPQDGARRPRPRDPLRLGLRLALADAQGNRIVGGNSQRDIFARRPIRTSPDLPPVGWIGITGGAEQLGIGDRLFLSDQLKTLVLTAAMALVLSAIGAFLLSRQFLKPVNRLAGAGRRLSEGDFSVRVDNDRDDEIGALIDQFNELAQNLETREHAERKWVSDTSHELKTPLAVLQAQIEALQDGVRKPTPEMLTKLHDSTSRLTRLVADLNLLANAREEEMQLVRTDEDVAELAQEALHAVSDKLRKAGLESTTDLEPDLIVSCDRFRLRQLIDNLLENSIRYTDAPGLVRLTGKRTGSGIMLAVDDTAPSPPGHSLGLLFDRFYRVEESRDRSLGGSGLGLAICREIARAHGGTISAEISELGGLKVKVTLPTPEKINA